jgi:branched-chain amino acid transport system substrate-binding protein
MKRFKLLTLALLAMFLVAVAGGCGSSSTDPIVISHAAPMTGDSGHFGKVEAEGIQIAIDEINAAGGIDGRTVKFVNEDDMGNPKEAANVAQRISSNSDIVAVVGHWNSSCTLAGIPIYDAAGIPVVTSSINQKISGSSKWVFRDSLTDEQAGSQIAEYAVKQLGAKRIAIFYTNNDFGKGQNDVFTRVAKGLGSDVVASESYIEGQSRDFTPQLTKIKNVNPDLIFLAGYYTEGAMIVQQARRLNMDIPIIGPDGLNSEEFVKLGGDTVEDVMFAGYFHSSMEFPGTAEYAEKYRDKYGYDSDTFAALAYDATRLILEGMKENGPTREGIQTYLEGVEDFPGVAGPITFDDKHDAHRKIIVLTVKDGKIVPADVQL